MRFKSTNSKRQKLKSQVNRNESERKRKKNKLGVPKINNSVFKAPKVLYESEWNTISDGDVLVDPVINNEETFLEMYQDLPVGSEETAIPGQVAPLEVSLWFRKVINLPERLLPFVKMSVLFKETNGIEPYPITGDYHPWHYEDNYTTVKGDGAKIYDRAGIPPTNSKYLTSELNDMSINLSKTSTIYKGTIDRQVGTDLTTEITNIDTRWNFSTVTATFSDLSQVDDPADFPDEERSDYDQFIVEATDSVSSGSVTGQGSYYEHRWTWVEVNPGTANPSIDWTETITVIKNHQMTAPLFGSGATTINGYGADGLSNVETSKVGTDIYRFLWYSNSRARKFKLDTFPSSDRFNLDNIPLKTDYETDSLPYSSITVDVNTGSHPEKIPGDNVFNQDANFRSELSHPIWVNLDPPESELEKRQDAPSLKHMLTTRGIYYFRAPAYHLQNRNVSFRDETWTPDGTGLTYFLPTENRDDKVVPEYMPITPNFKMKIMITLQTPNVYSETRKKNIGESR